MQEKHTFGLWGIAIGAAVVLVGGLSTGWLVTKGTANERAAAEVSKLMVHVCAQDMLANAASVALLKTKRTSDYDDAVRDSWRPAAFPAGIKVPTDHLFRRDCGKAIEAQMATAAKS